MPCCSAPVPLQPAGATKSMGPPPSSSRLPDPQSKLSGAAAADSKSRIESRATSAKTQAKAKAKAGDPVIDQATEQGRVSAAPDSGRAPTPPPTLQMQQGADPPVSLTPPTSTARPTVPSQAPLASPPPVSVSAPVQQSILQPSDQALVPSRPRGPTPPRPAGQAGSATQTVGLL